MVYFEFIHRTFTVAAQYQMDSWALFMEINNFNNYRPGNALLPDFQSSIVRLCLSIFPPFLSSIHYLFLTLQHIFDFYFHIA